MAEVGERILLPFSEEYPRLPERKLAPESALSGIAARREKTREDQVSGLFPPRRPPPARGLERARITQWSIAGTGP